MFKIVAWYKRASISIKVAVSGFFMRILAFGKELFERRIQKIYSANFFK